MANRIRTLALVCMASLSLAATACDPATIRLDTAKAQIVAQVGFKSLQQVALAGIQSGRFTGATKARIIELVNKGQGYENQAYAGQRAAILGLNGVVNDLVALGVK